MLNIFFLASFDGKFLSQNQSLKSVFRPDRGPTNQRKLFNTIWIRIKAFFKFEISASLTCSFNNLKYSNKNLRKEPWLDQNDCNGNISCKSGDFSSQSMKPNFSTFLLRISLPNQLISRHASKIIFMQNKYFFF